ncbi:MAG: MFS transporter [Patescibacteria group bacterium]
MLRWLRALVTGDMFYLTAFGLLTPIFALFLTERIPGANLLTVGISVAVYLAVVGVLRPFSQLYSKNDASGWRTQNLLWFGSAFVVLTPFLYLLSRDMIDVYVIQLLYGIGIAFCEPAWSRLIDKTCAIRPEDSIERYNAMSTLLAAGLALIGGFIADQQGVASLLIYLDVTTLAAALLLVGLYWRFGISQRHTFNAKEAQAQI